jgi:hypothetical protein
VSIRWPTGHYCLRVRGAYTIVTKTMLDSTDAVAANSAVSIQSTWQISVNKELASASLTRIMHTGVVTASSIQILLLS